MPFRIEAHRSWRAGFSPSASPVPLVRRPGRHRLESDGGFAKAGAENIRTRKLTDQELAQVWGGGRCSPLSVRPYVSTPGPDRRETGRDRRAEMVRDRRQRNQAGRRSPRAPRSSNPAGRCCSQHHRYHSALLPLRLQHQSQAAGFWILKSKAALDKLAPIPAWRTHDLRRTMASTMQRLGVQERVIEACLGHSSASRNGLLRVYQTYDFSVEKEKRSNGGQITSASWSILRSNGGAHDRHA